MIHQNHHLLDSLVLHMVLRKNDAGVITLVIIPKQRNKNAEIKACKPITLSGDNAQELDNELNSGKITEALTKYRGLVLQMKGMEKSTASLEKKIEEKKNPPAKPATTITSRKTTVKKHSKVKSATKAAPPKKEVKKAPAKGKTAAASTPDAHQVDRNQITTLLNDADKLIEGGDTAAAVAKQGETIAFVKEHQEALTPVLKDRLREMVTKVSKMNQHSLDLGD